MSSRSRPSAASDEGADDDDTNKQNVMRMLRASKKTTSASKSLMMAGMKKKETITPATVAAAAVPKKSNVTATNTPEIPKKQKPQPSSSSEEQQTEEQKPQISKLLVNMKLPDAPISATPGTKHPRDASQQSATSNSTHRGVPRGNSGASAGPKGNTRPPNSSEQNRMMQLSPVRMDLPNGGGSMEQHHASHAQAQAQQMGPFSSTKSFPSHHHGAAAPPLQQQQPQYQTQPVGPPPPIVLKDEERRVFNTLKTLCTKVKLDLTPMTDGDLLGGSFLMGNNNMAATTTWLDENENGEIYIPPRIPIFPEEFTFGQKPWPLSWWGIVDPLVTNETNETEVHPKMDDHQDNDGGRKRKGGGTDYQPHPSDHAAQDKRGSRPVGNKHEPRHDDRRGHESRRGHGGRF